MFFFVLSPGPQLVIGQPRHSPPSFLSFLLFIVIISALSIPRKRIQPWTDCLSLNFFMDIASVMSFFSGHGSVLFFPLFVSLSVFLPAF